ncbi:MAG: methyltransferase family protein [Acidimicrobiales bacterium]
MRVDHLEADDRRSRRRGFVLVAAQMALLAVLAAPWPRRRGCGPTVAAGRALQAAGLALAGAGALHLGPALTAQPVPKPGAELVTRGVYRRVRHPIYSGLGVFGLGSAMAAPHPVRAAAAAALVALLAGKAAWEERMLAARVPGYERYQRSAGRFLPRLRPPAG